MSDETKEPTEETNVINFSDAKKERHQMKVLEELAEKEERLAERLDEILAQMADMFQDGGYDDDVDFDFDGVENIRLVIGIFCQRCGNSYTLSIGDIVTGCPECGFGNGPEEEDEDNV